MTRIDNASAPERADEYAVQRQDRPNTALTALALLAPSLIIFVYPMLTLIARNSEYFGGRYGVGRDIYVAALVYLIGGIVLYALRRAWVVRLPLLVYLLSAPAAFVHGLLYQVSPSGFATLTIFVLVVIGAMLLLRRPIDGIIRTSGWYGLVLIVAMGASTALAINASPAGAAAEPAAAAAPGDSDRVNIYHVILDEFQTEMFLAVLNDRIRDKLQGFTLYPEAVTTYGRTEMALAEMFSLRNYSYRMTPSDFVDRAYQTNSSIRILESNGYTTTGHIRGRIAYRDNQPFDTVHYHGEAKGTTLPGYADLANSLWVYSVAPRRVARSVIPQRHFEQLTGGVLLPDDAPSQSVHAFQSFLDQEESLPPRGRYTYVHLLLPHFPNVVEPDCSYVSGEETGPVEQSQCATKLVVDMVDELRRLGRYDDSMIVVQGDHGSRYELLDGQLQEVQAGHSTDEYNTARSRMLLLVKPPGATQPFTTSDRPALITDVMPTIFDAAGIAEPPRDGRASLLAESFPARKARSYHFYPKDPDVIIDGHVRRYVVKQSGLTFERVIEVPVADGQ